MTLGAALVILSSPCALAADLFIASKYNSAVCNYELLTDAEELAEFKKDISLLPTSKRTDIDPRVVVNMLKLASRSGNIGYYLDIFQAVRPENAPIAARFTPEQKARLIEISKKILGNWDGRESLANDLSNITVSIQGDQPALAQAPANTTTYKLEMSPSALTTYNYNNTFGKTGREKSLRRYSMSAIYAIVTNSNNILDIVRAWNFVTKVFFAKEWDAGVDHQFHIANLLLQKFNALSASEEPKTKAIAISYAEIVAAKQIDLKAKAREGMFEIRPASSAEESMNFLPRISASTQVSEISAAIKDITENASDLKNSARLQELLKFMYHTLIYKSTEAAFRSFQSVLKNAISEDPDMSDATRNELLELWNRANKGQPLSSPGAQALTAAAFANINHGAEKPKVTTEPRVYNLDLDGPLTVKNELLLGSTNYSPSQISEGALIFVKDFKQWDRYKSGSLDHESLKDYFQVVLILTGMDDPDEENSLGNGHIPMAFEDSAQAFPYFKNLLETIESKYKGKFDGLTYANLVSRIKTTLNQFSENFGSVK